MEVTDQMKSEIENRYPFENSSVIAKDLGISVHTVNKWAVKLHLRKDPSYRNPNRISEEQESIIREFYPLKGSEYVAKLLNKKPKAVAELARRLGLKCEIDPSRRGSLEPLLSGTIQSYYWLGFIAADGYISKTGHLLVSQSEKDKENIYRLANFLSGQVKTLEQTKSGYATNNSLLYRVAISDKVLGLKIYELFKISAGQKKTYTPISVGFIKTQEEAMAFLCGFIDGDGSRYPTSLKIECDISQLEMFKNLMDLIPQYKGYLLKEVYRKQQDKNFCLFNTNKELMNALLYFSKTNKIGSSRKFY